MAVEKELKIKNKLGLHARPAMLLVQAATQFQSDIKIVKGDIEVNAKSIMGVLILAAEKGSIVKVIADGPDENEAVDSIAKLFTDGFGED